MTAFSMFTDDELDAMESAFFNEGLKSLVYEIRKERRYRESRKAESEDEKSCSNCKSWRLDRNDENRRCIYCFDQDEWEAESEEDENN